MSQVLEKLDRLTQMAERLEGWADRIPRLAEMFGVALFAGQASERMGGRFSDGAIGGIIADGLAHSQLPNNQVGGIALGTYFAGLGLLAIAPSDPFGSLPPVVHEIMSPTEVPKIVTNLTREECTAQGGVVIESLLSSIGLAPPACRLPD